MAIKNIHTHAIRSLCVDNHNTTHEWKITMEEVSEENEVDKNA